MILSAHMLVGATIGTRTKKYWLLFILAVFSHFLLDTLPHWEYSVDLINVSHFGLLLIISQALIDLSAGAIIIAYFTKSASRFRLMITAFFALLPDGLVFSSVALKTVFGLSFNWLNQINLFHSILHIPAELNNQWLGLAIEIIIMAVCVWKLKNSTQTKKATQAF